MINFSFHLFFFFNLPQKQRNPFSLGQNQGDPLFVKSHKIHFSNVVIVRVDGFLHFQGLILFFLMDFVIFRASSFSFFLFAQISYIKILCKNSLFDKLVFWGIKLGQSREFTLNFSLKLRLLAKLRFFGDYFCRKH